MRVGDIVSFQVGSRTFRGAFLYYRKGYAVVLKGSKRVYVRDVW